LPTIHSGHPVSCQLAFPSRYPVADDFHDHICLWLGLFYRSILGASNGNDFLVLQKLKAPKNWPSRSLVSFEIVQNLMEVWQPLSCSPRTFHIHHSPSPLQPVSPPPLCRICATLFMDTGLISWLLRHIVCVQAKYFSVLGDARTRKIFSCLDAVCVLIDFSASVAAAADGICYHMGYLLSC
jgi:hypothetical protein